MILGRQCRSPRSAASTVCAGATSIATSGRTLSWRRSSARKPSRLTMRMPRRFDVFRKLDWREDAPRRSRGSRSRPVMHAIDVVDLFKNGQSWILTADDLGTSLDRLGKRSDSEVNDDWQPPCRSPWPIADGAPSKRGASEVHAGRMADGQCLLATIEPWHGNRVAVYLAAIVTAADGHQSLGPPGGRTVLDDTLADGHALWLADVDRDGDDEVFAGHRGKDHRVSMYDFDRTDE